MTWGLTTWWLIGGVALAFTGISLLGLRDNIVALFVTDAVSVYLWVLFAIQAFAVDFYTETGTQITQHYPSLGYLALVFGVLMILDLFVSVFEAMAGQASDPNGE